MPVGVELQVRCQQILNEIATTSQSIRGSALVHADNQSRNASEKFRQQMEKIRTSAEAILEAISTASSADYSIDDQFIEWLLWGEPRACLNKLREMDKMLKPMGHGRPPRVSARPFVPAENKLIQAIVFFDKHADLFHFLLTPDIWWVS